MRQYQPSTEVDFVVIGSGAAGGIMAKELSVAGFSVVVLEQGGPGRVRARTGLQQGRVAQYVPASPEDRLMSDPVRQPNTFRRERQGKGGPRHHSYGCVSGGGTVTYGGSSWRHLPYEFNEATHEGAIRRHRLGGLAGHLRRDGALLHEGRMGDGHLRRCASIRRSVRRCRSLIRCRRCR